MAAGNSTIYLRGLSSGKVMTIYTYEAGSDAVLARLPLDGTAIATANSPKYMIFDEPMVQVDFVARSTTSGGVAWVAAGVKTQAAMSMAAHGGTNAGRPRQGYKFRPQVMYELQVVQALDA